MDARSLALACLQDCPRLGSAAIGAIIRHCSGEVPPDLYGHNVEWYVHELGLRTPAAKALNAYIPDRSNVYGKLTIRLVTIVDDAYPPGLRRMEHPPPLLAEHGRPLQGITKGNFSVLCSARYEVDRPNVAKDAIQTGLDAGYCAVSGHNRPVYQWAILAAKRSARASVMVLDRGFLSAFDTDMMRDPVAAARIWGYGFDSDHCTAISPFRLRDNWAPPNGRFRDAMVVALSDTIIVMGMRPDGTIHRLCMYALSRGQTVYADDAALEHLDHLGALPWTGSLPSACDSL